ncbi:unnamed protein product [Rotaria sordida]|uniref:Uncharacterized protein n=1 Tax=Rotaria sordida TaxID=392033 RepID=A0A815IS68_9BILA|nr:unnamed protein product [Rotaria sordida]
MRFEQINEKAPIVPMQPLQSTTKQEYAPTITITKTRRTLLILLGIHMVLALFYFIERIVVLAKYHNVHKDARNPNVPTSNIGNVISGAILIVYLILYIVMVVKYVRIGILIFAWLGILELVGLVILIVFAIVAIATFSAVLHDTGVGLAFSVTLLIIAVLTFIFTMLTVIFSFKLAKLIKIQHNYQHI